MRVETGNVSTSELINLYKHYFPYQKDTVENMFYDFNPRHRANHITRRHLGEPGKCNIYMGTDSHDPKYDGPCGSTYQAYVDCLRTQEYNRKECRPAENNVITCEKDKLSDVKKQLDILKKWRNNKGKLVREPVINKWLFRTHKEIIYNFYIILEYTEKDKVKILCLYFLIVLNLSRMKCYELVGKEREKIQF